MKTLSIELAIERLESRGVTVDDITDLVFDLQTPYVENLTKATCKYNVVRVLSKREVQNALLTGIELDQLAEEGKLQQPLQDIVASDEGLYGIDEIIALAIVNVYGSIGLTNFGYVDKIKPGIIAKLNDHADGKCHTFLDDIVGAIAAAASSRLAHSEEGAEVPD
ncbi:low temperature requirement C protein [Geomicrobium sp. JCM 19037]|uniref:phosphatidylglycerophosphatase A family protein n=1 Tax=unclassified Geomicrobium TaxID=2628951 RepID=UPI00045F27CA|nr:MULTISPECIES: phosphatidylglycerophosphatase A [unclassified Geomicrobium]GAK05264.1 low temperature requirement C protein [Geomicrobium sp. JCM 19037]GAK14698.1 low temperature requirement C protein [Geomicrobium sp. JCM 19039]